MSRDPLKVLYCSFDVIPEPTGTSARATELLRALTAFNVDALTAKSPDHPHIERFHGARLMRVPVGSGDLLVRAQAFERAVRRQLESDEYHLVHFTDPYGGYAVCELKEQYSFKLVYEVVGFPSIEVKYTHPHLESDRRFMAKLRRQELFCLMNADAVIVGCEVTARMVQGLGVSRERIMVQPTPVDLAQYAGAGIPRPDRVPMRVIYAGSQISWQGLATLLSAVSIASRSCELRLAIMGPQHPSWRLQLEEMIKYRKLSEIVELRDPVPPEDMVKALAAADVGVAPFERSERTTAQGAPVSKIAHYLAAGRPVVVSDLPMIRELVDESCALFHAPGDDEGLARSLVALAHDPARRIALGAEAAKRAQSRLSSEAARVNVLKLYAGLLAELGEQIEIPEAVVPDVSSDAPTCIGAFKPDDATVTHFEMGSADAMTDPFGRLEGRKTGQTEAFTTPQAPPSAPNLFVSESLLRGESGSSDGPVGTDPAAPARELAPSAEEAGAGSDPLEAVLVGVEIELEHSDAPSATLADPFEADLAWLASGPVAPHGAVSPTAASPQPAELGPGASSRIEAGNRRFEPPAAESPVAAADANEHAAEAQLQAPPSDQQTDDTLLQGSLILDPDDPDATVSTADELHAPTAAGVETPGSSPSLAAGAAERVLDEAAQPSGQSSPAGRAIGTLPENAESESVRSATPVAPGEDADGAGGLAARGDGQVGRPDVEEHLSKGGEAAAQAPEPPSASLPCQSESGASADPWVARQESARGAGFCSEQAAVPAWNSGASEPPETWAWGAGPVEWPVQGSADESGWPSAAAPVVAPSEPADGTPPSFDGRLERPGAGPTEGQGQEPGAVGATSELSESEGPTTLIDPLDVGQLPWLRATGAVSAPVSPAPPWLPQAAPAGVAARSDEHAKAHDPGQGGAADASWSPTPAAPAWASRPEVPESSVEQKGRPAAAGLAQGPSAEPATRAPASAPSAALPWDSIFGSARAAAPAAEPEAEQALPEASPDDVCEVDAPSSPPAPSLLSPHGAPVTAGGAPPAAPGPTATLGAGGPAQVTALPWERPAVAPQRPAAPSAVQLPPIVRMPGAAHPRGAVPPVLGGRPAVLGTKPPVLGLGGAKPPHLPAVDGRWPTPPGAAGHLDHGAESGGEGSSPAPERPGAQAPVLGRAASANAPGGPAVPGGAAAGAARRPPPLGTSFPHAVGAHAAPPVVYPPAVGAQSQPPATVFPPVLGPSGQAPGGGLSPGPGAQLSPKGPGHQPAPVAYPPGPGTAQPPAGAGPAMPTRPAPASRPAIPDAPGAAAGQAAHFANPRAAQPVLPQAAHPPPPHASVEAERAPDSQLSISSGVPPSDEWLGHVVFGYAPFRVPLARRALTGEFQVKPLQRP